MERCPKCKTIALRTNVVRRTASGFAGSMIGMIISPGSQAHALHAAKEISNKLTPTKNYICPNCGHTWKVKDEL